MKNILQKLWLIAPLSWAVIRKREYEILSQHYFKKPVLEVGCGDGEITSILFKNKNKYVDVGIDIDKNEIRRASIKSVYKKVLIDDITNSKLPSGRFNSVFSNGVYEHIPKIDAALKETHRVMNKKGRLYLTFPTRNYGNMLLLHIILNTIGLTSLANKYSSAVNKLFAHHNLYSKTEWQKKLSSAGFTIIKHEEYNNLQTVWIHEFTLIFAVFTKQIKKRTNKMVLFPSLRKYFVFPFSPIISSLVKKQLSPRKASLFIVAQKV